MRQYGSANVGLPPSYPSHRYRYRYRYINSLFTHLSVKTCAVFWTGALLESMLGIQESYELLSAFNL
jgi:hypothetical protein